MHVVRKSNLLRTTSATEQEGVMVHSIVLLQQKPSRLVQLGTAVSTLVRHDFPWLAQRLYTSRRRGTRLLFWSESFRNSGSPPPNVVPGRLLWLLGKPCHHIRAAHTTPSCSDLLSELSFTHSTKPNFPAVGKIFKCLTECASHRLEHTCCLPLLATPPCSSALYH